MPHLRVTIKTASRNSKIFLRNAGKSREMTISGGTNVSFDSIDLVMSPNTVYVDFSEIKQACRPKPKPVNSKTAAPGSSQPSGVKGTLSHPSILAL